MDPLSLSVCVHVPLSHTLSLCITLFCSAYVHTHRAQFNPIHEFPYNINGQAVDMVFTSVAGHLMEVSEATACAFTSEREHTQGSEAWLSFIIELVFPAPDSCSRVLPSCQCLKAVSSPYVCTRACDTLRSSNSMLSSEGGTAALPLSSTVCLCTRRCQRWVLCVMVAHLLLWESHSCWYLAQLYSVSVRKKVPEVGDLCCLSELIRSLWL